MNIMTMRDRADCTNLGFLRPIFELLCFLTLVVYGQSKVKSLPVVCNFQLLLIFSLNFY